MDVIKPEQSRGPYGPNGRARRYDQSYATYEGIFASVASFYVESRERLSTSPISASNPDAGAHRGVRPSLLCHWVIDNERVLEAACNGNVGMEDACLALLREYAGFGKADVSSGMKQDVICAVGSMIQKRGTSPQQYFRTIRRRAIS